jgi:hypothetical protein
LHIHAHPLGNLLGHVDVEALEIATVGLEGLRRVGRVGRDAKCTPVFDLLQEVSFPAATPRGAASPSCGDDQ